MGFVFRLFVLALALAWYQLPVIQERSQALALGGFEVALNRVIDGADAAVGGPPRRFRSLVESRKIELQAWLLHGLFDVAPAVAPASTKQTRSSGGATGVSHSAGLAPADSDALATVSRPEAGSADASVAGSVVESVNPLDPYPTANRSNTTTSTAPLNLNSNPALREAGLAHGEQGPAEPCIHSNLAASHREGNTACRLPRLLVTTEDFETSATGTARPISDNVAPGSSGGPSSASIPPPKPSAEGSTTFLLVGDSVMGEIAYGLKRWSAKRRGWLVVDAHKVSSGLCNSGYYDWPAVFKDLVEQNKPQVVAMMIGANDQQDIFVQRKRLPFGSPAWVVAYSERVTAILDLAEKQGASVYWLVPPVMRAVPMEKHMELIRKTVREAVTAHGGAVALVDEGAQFVDKDNHYVETGTVNGKKRGLRADDGVHLTAAGAQIYVDSLLRAVAPASGGPGAGHAGAARDEAALP